MVGCVGVVLGCWRWDAEYGNLNNAVEGCIFGIEVLLGEERLRWSADNTCGRVERSVGDKWSSTY